MRELNKIPFHIKLMSNFLPILKSEGNLARGEIVKAYFIESDKNQHKFGDQLVGCEGGFDYIWRHIALDYFKVVGKWAANNMGQ